MSVANSLKSKSHLEKERHPEEGLNEPISWRPYALYISACMPARQARWLGVLHLPTTLAVYVITRVDWSFQNPTEGNWKGKVGYFWV